MNPIRHHIIQKHDSPEPQPTSPDPFLPAHCKHRLSSPKLLTEQLKQTYFPHAPHAALSAMKSTSIPSPTPFPNPAPQSSQLEGAIACSTMDVGVGVELIFQNRCRDCCLPCGVVLVCEAGWNALSRGCCCAEKSRFKVCSVLVSKVSGWDGVIRTVDLFL